MAAGTYNFMIEQGATFKRVLTWTDQGGNPVPLAGKHARMQIRGDQTSDTVILELSTEDGHIQLNDPGQIVWFIGADLTATLDFKQGVYDFEVYDPLDLTIVERVLQGKVALSKEVTR
jgi:hypothetical protein